MRKIFPFLALIAATASANGQTASDRADIRYIFFDWGKTEVTRDGSALLDQLSSSFQPGQSVRLTGYSDRSGPAASNLRTSRIRAEAVRDYLVGKGVPRGAISVSGAGERDFLISTEDGVREVQNRRVEIQVVGP